MYGQEALANRILQEAYEKGLKNGPEAMYAFLDKQKQLNPSVMDMLEQARSKAAKPAKKLMDMADDANRFFGEAHLDDLVGKIPIKRGGATLSRIATSTPMRFAGRALPILGGIGAVTDVADIVAGDESLANKAMDTAAMGVGGGIGAVVGLGNPLVAATGASLGKMGSDALQYLFGDKLTPEQRKMREALMMLQGGRY
jgi:hypothetical protein